MERKLKKLEKEEEDAFYSLENRELYNDENEKKKVHRLRVIVEKQDPTCKVIYLSLSRPTFRPNIYTPHFVYLLSSI